MRLLPFDYAVRNLERSRARLVLSIAGSALVVLLALCAAGFVRGMAASLEVTGSPHNIILMGAGSEESVERSEINASVPSLLEATVDGIRQRAGVSYISPEVHVMLPASAGDDAAPSRQIMLRGITPQALLVHDQVRLIEGRLPEPGRDEIIVGRMLGATLGARAADLEMMDTLTIDGRTWTIVGRFAAPGTVMEGEAWTALTDLMAATRRDTVSCAVVTIDPAIAEFADIAAFTKMRPDLELVAVAETEYYRRLGEFFRPVAVVVWITAVLIGLAGLFGGLNTMYAAFASRVREIGTLRAIGYRRRAIVVSLVQESVMASAAGAVGAAVIGLFALDGLAVRFSMGTFGLAIDSIVLAIGLGAGLAVGVIGAIPPAVRCLRLSIPDALKAA